jgi:cytoskeletal protein CcmA (bactofilin family)
MKKSISGFMVSITVLLTILIGCDGLITSNVEVKDDDGSGHYYVDRVPANGIPIIDDLNNGDPHSTDYVIAEAFNKYDAIYLVGKSSGVTVTVPPGKILYVAPGSNVIGFNVAAEVSKGETARNAGLDAGAGPGTLVVLDGATMNLSGSSTLGGLLQVNVGGIISGSSATITGAGRVIVGGKVSVKSITVAGEVCIAQGDGYRYGVVEADIDTTYLSFPTLTPDENGRIDSSSRSNDDFYAFENAEPATSRNVTVDGVVIGNIISGGHIYVAENNRVAGLNKFYGYVAGSGSANATIITYGNAEVLGNVEGSVIAKGSVTVGSRLSSPHRAQVRSAIYSRTGNVVINKRANSGDIVAYQGSVTIEAGAGATGIDTYYNNYNNGDGSVTRGDVIVRGIVNNSVGASSGSGNIDSGGSIIVAPYRSESADFSFNGFVGGDVSSRRSATIDGVVLGSLSAHNSFDGTGTQDVSVNGYVGGRVTAGGTLAVADHHNAPDNSNSGASIGGVYANGYVGGGAEVYGQNGTGQSILRGLVEGGSLYIHSPANVTITATGRVNTIGSDGATVSGTLAIEALGELDADAIDEIYYNGSSPLNGIYVYAHAGALANDGRLGPPGSGITIASGAKIYVQDPIVIPDGAILNYDSGAASGLAANTEHDNRFRALAASNVIHTNVTPSRKILGADTALNLTVGAYNSVTLLQDAELTGTINVHGLLALNGHELDVGGVITLASDTSAIFNYDTGNNYANGYISFGYTPNYGSLKFTGAATALHGLSSPSIQRTDYDYAAGQPYNADPVVFGATRPYSDSVYSTATVADFELPYPAILQDTPGGTFAPGAGAVLKGSSSGVYDDYISKDSRFVWGFTAYTP